MMTKTADAPDKVQIITSGNPDLDARMGGGLPVGSMVLIEGTSGAGKSVLSQQIIWGALQDGHTVTLFTSENTVKSLIPQMASIDLDVLDFLLLGKLRVYPVELARLGSDAPGLLVQAMRTQGGRGMIVIDSFTSALAKEATDLQLRSFFEESKRLCAAGTTILITLHSGAVPSDLMNPIRSMCDAHLTLRSEQDGQKLVKTLEVSKIRGAASGTGSIVGFDVEPGWGIRVVPISKARG